MFAFLSIIFLIFHPVCAQNVDMLFEPLFIKFLSGNYNSSRFVYMWCTGRFLRVMLISVSISNTQRSKIPLVVLLLTKMVN